MGLPVTKPPLDPPADRSDAPASARAEARAGVRPEPGPPPAPRHGSPTGSVPLRRTLWRRVGTGVSNLLVATMPLGAVLVAYFAAAWLNASLSRDPVPGSQNGIGLPLHVTEPAVVDRAVFGVLPSAWLQARLHPTDAGHWWDAIAAVVYTSHFVVVPALAVVLWLRSRTRFRLFIWCVFAMAAVGISLYVLYPMAPPWMAARDGLLEPVQRISGIGWEQLGLGFLGSMQSSGQAGSNAVAAMPSLHAGAAALVAAFLCPTSPWWGRALLVAYAAAMAVTLVYTGEHYALDVAVGVVLAVGAVLVVSGVRRGIDRRTARRAEECSRPPDRRSRPA
jgi:membrane-associated phospholipid phosphatase